MSIEIKNTITEVFPKYIMLHNGESIFIPKDIREREANLMYKGLIKEIQTGRKEQMPAAKKKAAKKKVAKK